MIWTVSAVLTCLVWLVLLAGRSGFWRAAVRDTPDVPVPANCWPSVTAIVPARDEAATVGTTVGSLLRQDYAGALSVIVIDDHSEDDTSAIARRAAREMGAQERL